MTCCVFFANITRVERKCNDLDFFETFFGGENKPVVVKSVCAADYDQSTFREDDVGMSFSRDHECNPTKNCSRRQQQPQCHRLLQKNDTAQCRDDRHTELYCCGVGSFECG